MAHIQGEVLIGRPVEEVFDFVADERTEPTYNRNMLSSQLITDGPIGVGTRFRGTIRTGRRSMPMDIEYTRFDRPRQIASTTRMSNADFTGTLTFTPTPAGTRLRWSWQARPKGATRLLAPLFVLVGAHQERRMWTALRPHLETVTPAGTHRATAIGRTPTALGEGTEVVETKQATSTAPPSGRAWLPPRWFVVLFWHSRRALVRATHGRVGLWRPKPGGEGVLRLTTSDRCSGQPRQVLVGYFEDGQNLIAMAMNGWGAAEPAWWLNLQAHPDAIAQTRDGVRQVRARPARGPERERLWARWAQIDRDQDAYAARRSAETAVVVLEPQDAAAGPARGRTGPASATS